MTQQLEQDDVNHSSIKGEKRSKETMIGYKWLQHQHITILIAIQEICLTRRATIYDHKIDSSNR
jgi:hypothetical protein